MKKLNYLLPIILFGLALKPALAQVNNLSDWHVPIPASNSDYRVPPPNPPHNTNGGDLSGALAPGISLSQLMEALPPIPGGSSPGSPPPYLTDQLKKSNSKRVSDADDERIANLVKKALANLGSCCCCCCTPPLPAPAVKSVPKKKTVSKSVVVTRKKQLPKPVKKPVIKAPAAKPKVVKKAPVPKVKTRYIVKYRYKYIPYTCNCTPNIIDTTKSK